MDEPGEFLLIGLTPYWYEEEGIFHKQNNPTPDIWQYDITHGVYSRGQLMSLHKVNPKPTSSKYAQPFQRQIGGF